MTTIRKRPRKDGTIAYAVLYLIDGRNSSATFEDQKSAELFRDMVRVHGAQRALEMTGLRDVHRSQSLGTTLKEWLEHHIAHLTGVTKASLYNYRNYIDKDLGPLGTIPLSQLSRDDISVWVQGLADKGASGKTIANKHAFLSGALKAAVIDGKIESNPAAGTRLPRTEKPEMVFLTREEFAVLLNAVAQRWRPMVEFLVASGARFGEVTALRPSDVNRVDHTVRISRGWKRTYEKGGREIGAPKTRKSVRTINVPASVLDKLDYSGEWLFVTRRNNPVRNGTFRDDVWYPALERAALKKRPRVHDLRHTCASWMIAAGIPLPVIQQHLGHESISTTVNLYGHLDRRSAQAAAAVIDQALRQQP